MGNIYFYIPVGQFGLKTITAKNVKDFKMKLEELGQKPKYFKDLGSSKLVRILFEDKSSTKLKKKDILLFIRYLSFGVNQGLTQLQALELLLESGNKRVERIVRAVMKRIVEGEELDKALEESGMDRMVCFRVTLALRSNKLGPMLSELDTELTEAWDFKKKLMTSLIYPCILIVLMIVMVVIMTGFIMPAIAEILADLGSEIPALTTAVLNGGQVIIKILTVIGIILAIIIPIHFIRMRKEKYRYKFGRFIYRTPVIRSIRTHLTTISVLSDLHYLLEAGVDTVEAINVIQKGQKNQYVKKSLQGVMNKILLEGTPLNEAMRDLNFITLQAKQFIKIGVESGGLVKVLKSVAVNTKNEFNILIKAIVTILEPTIMLIVLGMGGTLVIAIATALSSINDSI